MIGISSGGLPCWKGDLQRAMVKGMEEATRKATQGQLLELWRKGSSERQCPSPKQEKETSKSKDASGGQKSKGGESAHAATEAGEDGVWGLSSTHLDDIFEDPSCSF